MHGFKFATCADLTFFLKSQQFSLGNQKTQNFRILISLKNCNINYSRKLEGREFFQVTVLKEKNDKNYTLFTLTIFLSALIPHLIKDFKPAFYSSFFDPILNFKQIKVMLVHFENF